MPRLNDIDMETRQLPTGSYGYSAIGLDKLGASEYTLATIICDVSASVRNFSHQLEMAIQEIIQACRRSPRADNLMLRLVTFNESVQEIHGYKLLEDCNPSDYSNILNCDGMTALYDASENAIAAAVDYGADLTNQDYMVNAAVYILTDGDNNRGIMHPSDVNKVLNRALDQEALESIVSVLIGINTTTQLDQLLRKFQQEAGLDNYIGISDADEKSLAKLSQFVSKSISSQSQSLGSGQASTNLSF